MILDSVQNALAAYLKANCPSITQVLTEWPSANVPLQMPSLSILTTARDIENYSPELVSTDEVTDTSVTSLYSVGQQEFDLQIDIWARSKPERARLFDEFFRAMNPDTEVNGLRLQMADYFDSYSQFLVTKCNYQDAQLPAQTQEWRAIVTAKASAGIILTRTEFIMLYPTLTLTVAEGGAF